MTELPKPPKDKETFIWRQPSGAPVSCTEKIKVLNQNLAEMAQMGEDLVEDAVLMGCDEKQIRAVLADMVRKIPSPHQKR